VDAVARYFEEQPNAMAYFAQVDIGSNVKVSCIVSKQFHSLKWAQALQAILGQAKTLGKAIYVLSVDEHIGKVTHGNYLPPGMATEGFDARSWASSVAEVVGGKVGYLKYSIHVISDSFLRLVESQILPRVSAPIFRRLETAFGLQKKYSPRQHSSDL
jgi:alanyl-tRNA synthetase